MISSGSHLSSGWTSGMQLIRESEERAVLEHGYRRATRRGGDGGALVCSRSGIQLIRDRESLRGELCVRTGTETSDSEGEEEWSGALVNVIFSLSVSHTTAQAPVKDTAI